VLAGGESDDWKVGLDYQLNDDMDWALSFALANATDEVYHLNNFDLRFFDNPTFEAQPARPREWSLSFRHNFGL